MTIPEAIEWIEVLRDGWDNATNVTACNMAIQALKMKQHNNILKDVIEATKEPKLYKMETQPTKMRDATEEERKSVKDYIESISKPTGLQFEEELDFIQPHKKIPCTITVGKPCEDCIRRDDVDAYIAKLMSGYLYDEERTRLEEFSAYLWELPPVTPQRPKGKWIKCKSRFGVEYFKCSKCERKLDLLNRDDNYCNNCGSDNSESTKELFKEWDTRIAEMSGGDSE